MIDYWLRADDFIVKTTGRIVDSMRDIPRQNPRAVIDAMREVVE